MIRKPTMMVALVFSGVLALSIVSDGPSLAVPPGPPESVPVKVVNTEANPVPVTGSVAVPDTVDVNVVNALTITPSGTPYSERERADCNGVNCFITFSEVPEGKLLIIQYIGAFVRPTSSATIFDFLEVTTSDTENPGFGVDNYFPMERIGQAGASVVLDTWAVNAPVVVYVEAGSAAHFRISQRNNGDVLVASGMISGLLIDANGN